MKWPRLTSILVRRRQVRLRCVSHIMALSILVLSASISGSVCQSARAENPPAPASSAASEQFFVEQVLPVLREHCYECHSHASGEASGNLMVDSWAALTTGGTRGPAFKPSAPDDSLIVKALQYDDPDLQMPPSAQLDPGQIEIVRRWIAAGAVMPASLSGTPAGGLRSEAGTLTSAQSHWAYQPLQRWQPQPAGPAHGMNTALDAIIAEQLAAAGLEMSPPADRRTLLRRLSYDLTGLPPTATALHDFLSDARDDQTATTAVIDRLLSAPSFGERWARVWMDVARYADNKGYVFREDREYAAAYQYRDWLIDAFNHDLPYDQFVTRQLAADLLPGSAQDGSPTADELAALGFLTLGRRFLNNKHDIIDDRIDVVARGLMGMTLGCARCHDHKYDPLTQTDYYALYGVFLNTEEPGGDPWPHRLVDAAEEQQAFVFLRGSPSNRGETVQRRFVSVLAPKAVPFSAGSGRLDLATHIVSATNPLTPRVIANRIWLQLTGSSLVESPSDFGLRSPRPQQLQLLDQLAIGLIDAQWSLKSLIRSIVTSRAYQQSSHHRSAAFKRDPENALYWKMNRRRLEFEAFRDTLLACTGELDASLHGKSTPITTPPFSHRRTVYAYIDRQNLPQLFRTFDLASPDAHAPLRAQTSVPQQGLYLLNSDFVAELAQRLAARTAAHCSDPQEQCVAMFQSVLGREPTGGEREMMRDFMNAAATDKPLSSSARLELLAGGLLALNELAHLD